MRLEEMQPMGLCALDDAREEIERLKVERDRYKAALHEVVFACRTKISMKQKAREALFNEKTAHIPD